MSQPPEFPPPAPGPADGAYIPPPEAPTQVPTQPMAAQSPPPAPPPSAGPAAAAPTAPVPTVRPGAPGATDAAGGRSGGAGGLLGFDRDGLPAVLVAVGVALVSSAVVVSTVYSRKEGDLDWSNFVVGLLATIGLLGVAGAAQVVVPDAERRATLVSWPGAFGAIAVGLMIGVAITDDHVSAYLGGAVVVVLSVGGYLLTRRAPFVLSTIVGLVLVYFQGFDDVFGGDGGDLSGDNAPMKVGFGILAFVLIVTAAGWFLAETRVLSGVVVGIGGLAGMVTLLVTVVALRAVLVAFGGVGGNDDVEGSSAYQSSLSVTRNDPYKNDVYVILALCVVLALVWVVAATLTGAVGFKLLVVADAVTVIPLSTVALMVHHPTWWGVVPALVGGAVLVGVGLMVRSGTGSPPPSYAAPSGY